MAEVELSEKVKRLELPLRLLIPFDNEITQRGLWSRDLQIIFANCVADILDRLGVTKEQLFAIGEQYWEEKLEKEKK